MARDRKRAKQRQRRRSAERQPARVAARRDAEASAPDPLEDASAEVEIAEAALVDPPAAALDPDELPSDEDDAESGEDRRPPDRGGDHEDGNGSGSPPPAGRRHSDSGAELPREGSRFGNFLRACAAELRRVQWPDRRQVTQATGVVIGFVIIAGAYLGVLDAVFSKLIDAIL